MRTPTLWWCRSGLGRVPLAVVVGAAGGVPGMTGGKVDVGGEALIWGRCGCSSRLRPRG